jgi:hypothetical protein
MSEWHRVHAAEAAPGACGAWQFVQTAWADPGVAASVVLAP